MALWLIDYCWKVVPQTYLRRHRVKDCLEGPERGLAKWRSPWQGCSTINDNLLDGKQISVFLSLYTYTGTCVCVCVYIYILCIYIYIYIVYIYIYTWIDCGRSGGTVFVSAGNGDGAANCCPYLPLNRRGWMLWQSMKRWLQRMRWMICCEKHQAWDIWTYLATTGIGARWKMAQMALCVLLGMWWVCSTLRSLFLCFMVFQFVSHFALECGRQRNFQWRCSASKCCGSVDGAASALGQKRSEATAAAAAVPKLSLS